MKDLVMNQTNHLSRTLLDSFEKCRRQAISDNTKRAIKQKRSREFINIISEIQIQPVKPSDGLVGFASFVYGDKFYFGSIGIYTRPQGGYRLTYPTRKTSNGNFNIFHPINKDVANEIEKVIISKFEEVTKPYARHSSADLE